MPWKITDTEEHIKGLTPKEKERWVSTANSVLTQCIKGGGEEKFCEGKAIKIASGTVKEGAMNEWLEKQSAEVQEKFKSILAEKKELEEKLPKWKLQMKGGVIPLIEGYGEKDNVVPIKIIQPGWGSSGYYPKDVLERDGPKVFTKGVKMFWNHQTLDEEYQRPEGDLSDLAGEFVSDAVYKTEGIAGEGLYANAKIFSKYKDTVKELAPHIGVSIRASGIAEEGSVNGESGMVIEGITKARSVDFVTVPGAGGKVIEMFESVGRKPKENKMEKELKEALDKVAELEKSSLADKEALEAANELIEKQDEANLLKEAADFVNAELAEVEMPDLTKERLAKKLSAKPVLTEDKKLDTDAYKKAIEEAAKEEVDYLAKIVGSGEIKGMSGQAGETESRSIAESMQVLYKAQGFNKEEAEKMASIGE